jgi:hypothetical protein
MNTVSISFLWTSKSCIFCAQVKLSVVVAYSAISSTFVRYMASVEKQLLGTETVRVLRAKGVESIICGASANDVGAKFVEAGADSFLIKPFPCQKDLLVLELRRILCFRRNTLGSA